MVDNCHNVQTWGSIVISNTAIDPLVEL
ncbi:unnamed protein product [Calypogeia fissa]